MKENIYTNALPLLSALFWIVALFSALIPYADFEYGFFYASVSCLFGATITALGAGLNNKTQWSLPKSSLLFIGLCFWALALISVSWSEIPFVSFTYFWFFSLLPLSFLSFIFGPNIEKRLDYAQNGLLILMIVLALYGIYQFFFLPDLLFEGLIRAPLKNPNSLAAILSSGFFLALGRLYTNIEKRSLFNLLFSLAALLILCAIILTGSRGILLLSAISFILILIWLPKQSRDKTEYLVFIIITAILFSVFSAYHDPVGEGSPVFDYVKAASGGHEALYAERLRIWASTFNMIKDHFFLGTGIGTFFLYYPAYRPLIDETAGFMAHNDLLQFWAELGILAPILFCAFIFKAFIQTFKALAQTQQKQNDERIKLVISFCALGVLVVHSLISFNFHVVSALCIIGFLLADWFIVSRKILEKPSFTLKKPVWLTPLNGWLCLLLPALICLTLLGSNLSSNYNIKLARKALSDGDMPLFAHYVDTANRRAFNLNSKAYMLAASIPMGILETKKTTLPITEQQALYEQTRSLLDEALEKNPRTASVFYHRARLQDMVLFSIIPEDELSKEELLNKALTIDPLHLPSRESLARLYINRGEKKKALDLLLAGLGWIYVQHDPRPYYEMTKRLMTELNDFKKLEMLDKKIRKHKHKTKT